MQRLPFMIGGAAAFLAAHAFEVATWRELFASGDNVTPWFLNSGRAVAVTAVAIAIAAFVAIATGTRGRRPRVLSDGAAVAAGAGLAMTVTLFVVGPGSIAPLVLVIGWTITAASAAIGAVLGTRIPNP